MRLTSFFWFIYFHLACLRNDSTILIDLTFGTDPNAINLDLFDFDLFLLKKH